MSWDQLCLYVYNLVCHVTTVRTDGFCFLHAVEMVLYMDHYEVVTFDSVESTILGHLATNVSYYKMFHTGDILKDAKKYFKFGTYCDNALHLIVVARARALKLTLTIYQIGLKGNIQILKHTTQESAKEANLKFTCDPSNVANVMYGSAVLFLGLPRGIGSHKYYRGAPQYTMLVFGFSSLCTYII